MDEQESAEGQVDRLGQQEVLAGLGDGEHLAEGGGRRGDLVAGARVAVDRVHAAVVADDLGQGHRHVPTTGAHVDAAPSGADAESLECSGQRPPVDVVTQTAELGRTAPRPLPHRAVASPDVKVTMLLCDAAQVADGKLFVLGGGWSLTGPDPMPSAIALKIDVGWHEAEAGPPLGAVPRGRRRTAR